MSAGRPQCGGQQSCIWSLCLLWGLLKLLGIAEALLLAEMPKDTPSLQEEETTVTSKTGGNVTLYCRTDFQLSNLSVFWYHLSHHGLNTIIVHRHSFEAEWMDYEFLKPPKHFFLSIKPGVVALTLKDVKPQDSGTYKCILEDNHHSVERYMILQVTASKEILQKDEDSLVIYSMVVFISAGLVVWMISLGILYKRGDLQCPRNHIREL